MKRRHKMDPHLVSKQKWEIQYIAKKFWTNAATVRRAIKKAGRSRKRVYRIISTAIREAA